MPVEDIQDDFPNLNEDASWRISSEIDDGYNCIAFAVHDTRQFWDPDMIGVRGYYWPPGVPRDFRVTTLVKIYEIHGFKVCDNVDLEEGYEKVVVYGTDDGEGTHAARQLASGMWTSKLGLAEDIEHSTPEGLVSENLYGGVHVKLKRPRQ